MDNRTKLLLKIYKQPIFPKWARAKKDTLVCSFSRTLCPDESVLWNMEAEAGACADHIEMSGFFASAIISYGKTAHNTLRICRHLVVPNERLQPNVTQSSFSMNFSKSAADIKIDGKRLPELPLQARIKGGLEITARMGDVTVIRQFYPSVNHPALIEKICVKNTAQAVCQLTVRERKTEKIFPRRICVFRSIKAASGLCFQPAYDAQKSSGVSKTVRLHADESKTFYCVYYAVGADEGFVINTEEEIRARQNFVDEMFSALRLDTPSKELNAQFAHCILRGSESIFKTENGLMHSPGGGNYYAAIWTNDQCEYANPFFPFSGYNKGIQQAINGYRLYEKYMDRSSKPMRDKQPLVSSIIACGTDYWNGAGDRGDCEMYAYGLSRFLLSLADMDLMRSFFDDLVWCMDFALSRKTPEGVIASDSDELENRFSSGNANLFTSCLTYDALINSAQIAGLLDKDGKARLWEDEAKALRLAIERYFGAQIEGYQTYRYCADNTDLRAWICMPLSVEIFDRADETIRALFGKKLYENGMLRTSSSPVTWDRSLLFALRGTLLAGKAEQGTAALLDYCRNRLLGSHAPYAIEAYPEGNRAHLAAESLLFARVVTEGLFGLRAVGYKKLRIQPCLSDTLHTVSLSGLSLFGLHFSVHCTRNKITVEIQNKQYVAAAETAVFDFSAMRFE